MENKIDFKKYLKKIDFKNRRYALPAIALPFVVFIAFQIYGLAEDNEQKAEDAKVVTADINSDLPETAGMKSENKEDIINDAWEMDKEYSAIDDVKQEEIEKLTSESSYSDKEKRRIDSLNQVKQREDMVRSLEKQLSYNNYERNRIANMPRQQNQYQNTNNNGATTAAVEYAKEIRRMQKALRGEDEEEEAQKLKEKAKKIELNELERMELERLRQKEQEAEETQIVKKADDENDKVFFSVQEKNPEDELIKAMIDQTIKVRNGTRIRLKLIDDVVIDSVRMPKGTYLYALVTGFNGERVKANIKSILVGQKFVKVNLALYDYDGMEGFYVPSSAFREMTKNVGAQAVGGANMNMNNSGTNNMSAEYMALQALQQAYSGVTSAISSEIRKNKAKIKYNTMVFLINANN